MNKLDDRFKYIINPQFIGTYVVLLRDDKLLPVYILNQNYVRFNHCIVNVEAIFQFINKQQFRYNNYIQQEEQKHQESDEVNMFELYNFTLHHIHHEKPQTQNNSKNNDPNRKGKEKEMIPYIPEQAKKTVSKSV